MKAKTPDEQSKTTRSKAVTPKKKYFQKRQYYVPSLARSVEAQSYDDAIKLARDLKEVKAQEEGDG